MRSLPLLLLLAGACWPGAARSEPAPAGPAIVAAPADPLGTLNALRRAAELRNLYDQSDCERDAESGEVVVCGRRQRGGGMRIPWQPEPGARVHLVAGEPPGGMAAMGADGCLRLCSQPVMIDLIGGSRDVVNAIGRGIDRLLHPD